MEASTATLEERLDTIHDLVNYDDDSQDDKNDNDEEGAPPGEQNVNFSTVIPFVLHYFRRYSESAADSQKSFHKKSCSF